MKKLLLWISLFLSPFTTLLAQNKSWDKKTMNVIQSIVSPIYSSEYKYKNGQYNEKTYSLEYLERILSENYDTSFRLIVINDDSVLFKAIIKIMDKYDPKHNLKLRVSSNDCSHYMINKIYLKNTGNKQYPVLSILSLISELSHHVQYKKNPMRFYKTVLLSGIHTLRRFLFFNSKYPTLDNAYLEEYSDTKSFEYEAHVIIERKLLKDLVLYCSNKYYIQITAIL